MANIAQEYDRQETQRDGSVHEPKNLLPRRRFFNDMPDKGLFAACALIGSALIIFFKLWVYLKALPYNAELVALGAGTLMVVYGVIAYRIPAVQLRLDRLGDNFYYLGFIYTLASMSAALLELRRGVDIDALLGSFGIALFTTIVGVAGRVLFVQMRGEIDEIEATVRRDLLSKSNDLRAQLAIALREFETFHAAVRQAATESFSDTNKLVDTQIKGIEEVARAAADQTIGMFEESRLHVQKLGEVVVELSHVVADLSSNLGSLELPTDRFEKQLASFGDELDALVARLGAVVHQVEQKSQFRPVRRRRWYWPFWRT